MNRSELAERTLLKPRLKRALDVNIDLAQSRDAVFWQQNEYKLLQKVSSVNLPCLVHDGEPDAILKAVEQAQLYNCALGAHIAYPDPQHQGYQEVACSLEQLKAWVRVQLGALTALLQPTHSSIEHVRPHGLLYRHMSEQSEVALAVAEAVASFDPWLRLVLPVGPGTEALAQHCNLPVAYEFYLGKRYFSSPNKGSSETSSTQSPSEASSSLSLDWAHWHDDLSMRAAADQARQLLRQQSITAQNGQTVAVPALHTLHLSPHYKHVEALSTQLLDLLKQPLPLAVSAVHASGWVDKVDDRLAGQPCVEDY